MKVEIEFDGTGFSGAKVFYNGLLQTHIRSIRLLLSHSNSRRRNPDVFELTRRMPDGDVIVESMTRSGIVSRIG